MVSPILQFVYIVAAITDNDDIFLIENIHS